MEDKQINALSNFINNIDTWCGDAYYENIKRLFGVSKEDITTLYVLKYHIDNYTGPEEVDVVKKFLNGLIMLYTRESESTLKSLNNISQILDYKDTVEFNCTDIERKLAVNSGIVKDVATNIYILDGRLCISKKGLIINPDYSIITPLEKILDVTKLKDLLKTKSYMYSKARMENILMKLDEVLTIEFDDDLLFCVAIPYPDETGELCVTFYGKKYTYTLAETTVYKIIDEDRGIRVLVL